MSYDIHTADFAAENHGSIWLIPSFDSGTERAPRRAH
jgi:hypothetical protein